MTGSFQQQFMDALGRRAAQQPQGPLRERLEARLAALRVVAASDAGPSSAPAPAPAPGRAALTALLEHIAARRGPVPVEAAAQALPHLKRTWSRLKADQRLAQSRATLPRNAGPLNSQHLVHRSLALMRELSPAYFERFVAHVDTLLWLERTQGQRKPPGGRRA